MGCCESTVRQATASPPLLSPPPPPPDRNKLAASSAMEVEEKVKEVLCETPASSKPVAPEPKTGDPPQNREPASPAKTDQFKPLPPPERPLSVPEDSKFRGISDQRRAERSPVRPRPPRTRSFSGELGACVSRGSGKSPTRIRPDGIGGSVRIVQSRDAAWAQRLDLGVGERSGRRSGPGSPAKRGGVSGGGTKPGADRVPSMRRADLSPGRVRRDPSGGGSSKRRESKGRESLESPLVSLECFIFL